MEYSQLFGSERLLMPGFIIVPAVERKVKRKWWQRLLSRPFEKYDTQLRESVPDGMVLQTDWGMLVNAKTYRIFMEAQNDIDRIAGGTGAAF